MEKINKALTSFMKNGGEHPIVTPLNYFLLIPACVVLFSIICNMIFFENQVSIIMDQITQKIMQEVGGIVFFLVIFILAVFESILFRFLPIKISDKYFGTSIKNNDRNEIFRKKHQFRGKVYRQVILIIAFMSILMFSVFYYIFQSPYVIIVTIIHIIFLLYYIKLLRNCVEESKAILYSAGMHAMCNYIILLMSLLLQN